jgi:hypothetical protein
VYKVGNVAPRRVTLRSLTRLRISRRRINQCGMVGGLGFRSVRRKKLQVRGGIDYIMV